MAKKVFIKRKNINEDVAINDPTLAQQYLAVKKQITDKQTERDNYLKSANQIDNEINILQKNLLAIETKAVGQSADKAQNVEQESRQQQETQPNQQQQAQAQVQAQQEVKESYKDILKPKKNIPTLDEYREIVIQHINAQYVDGETLVYEYSNFLEECYKDFDDPSYCAEMIIEKDRSIDDDMEEGFIGGDVMSMNTAMKTQPTRVAENVHDSLDFDIDTPLKDRFSKYDVISIDGDEKIIVDIDQYSNDTIITFDDDTSLNASEMDREGIEFVRHLSKDEIYDLEYDEDEELAKLEKEEELEEEANDLEDKLDRLKREENEIHVEMEQTISYPEETHDIFKPKHQDEIANVFGNELMKNEDAQEEVLKQLYNVYNDENFPWHKKAKYYDEAMNTVNNKSYNDVTESFDTTKWDTVNIEVDSMNDKDWKLFQQWNNIGRIKSNIDDEVVDVKFIPGDVEVEELLSKYLIDSESIEPYMNESVYDDMVDSIDTEIKKLTDIKSYISQYIDDEEPPIKSEPYITDELDDEEESTIDDVDDLPFSEPYDIETEPYDDEESTIDDLPFSDPEENKFEPSEEEKIVDETLKAEDKKPPYEDVSEDLEKDEEDVDLEMMNYDIDDESEDEYVFHIRVNTETDNEIIAKIYKDNPTDYWTVRVVKGDEEPLQSMKFESELDKLDIIGYLADFYEEIEIIDPKEYEYLLDDKEKVDAEYYEDLVEESVKDLLIPIQQDEFEQNLEEYTRNYKIKMPVINYLKDYGFNIHAIYGGRIMFFHPKYNLKTGYDFNYIPVNKNTTLSYITRKLKKLNISK